MPTTSLHMLLVSCKLLGHDDAKGDGKRVQLPLRKCATTGEEEKEIWVQPSLFAPVYLSGSSSIQAQPDREIPVLQLVRYSRLVTRTHTTQMSSMVAGAGKHSHSLVILHPLGRSYILLVGLTMEWVPWFGLSGNPWSCFEEFSFVFLGLFSSQNGAFLYFLLPCHDQAVIIQITPCRGSVLSQPTSGCSRLGSLGISLEVGQLQAFEGNIDVLYPYNSLTKLVSF